MNAKKLFESTRVNEAGDAVGQHMRSAPPPPGATSTKRPPPQEPEGMNDFDMPDDPRALLGERPVVRSGPRPGMMRGPGGPGMHEPMQGPFTGQDMSRLKDVLLLILCKAANNTYDQSIVMKMMQSQPLEPGEVQHILDEAQNHAHEIPETHGKVLQKAYQWVQSQG